MGESVDECCKTFLVTFTAFAFPFELLSTSVNLPVSVQCDSNKLKCNEKVMVNQTANVKATPGLPTTRAFNHLPQSPGPNTETSFSVKEWAQEHDASWILTG